MDGTQVISPYLHCRFRFSLCVWCLVFVSFGNFMDFRDTAKIDGPAMEWREILSRDDGTRIDTSSRHFGISRFKTHPSHERETERILGAGTVFIEI